MKREIEQMLAASKDERARIETKLRAQLIEMGVPEKYASDTARTLFALVTRIGEKGFAAIEAAMGGPKVAS